MAAGDKRESADNVPAAAPALKLCRPDSDSPEVTKDVELYSRETREAGATRNKSLFVTLL